jgi:hypothetical protein
MAIQPVFGPRAIGGRADSDEALSDLLHRWNALLQTWANDGSLEIAIEQALQLNSNDGWLKEMLISLSQGDTSSLPGIQLLDEDEIRGAAGAYSSDTATIYLNRQWLERATSEEAISVLNEELGHHLDAMGHETDTAGDEGKYFAALLNGTTLSATDFSADAKGEITVDGQTLNVEFSILDTSYGGLEYMEVETFVNGTTGTSFSSGSSIYYQGSSGTNDILATSWDASLASSHITPSGITAWQVYTSASKINYFTVFAPFVETINFNGTPITQNSSPTSSQRISYFYDPFSFSTYSGFRTGGADDLVFGRILDSDDGIKSANESYILAASGGNDTLFIPLRKESSHLAYEGIEALGISRLRFAGTNNDEVSYITSGVENLDYLNARFNPAGTREYNLVDGNPNSAVGILTESTILSSYLHPVDTTRTTTGTTGDDLIHGISQKNTTFYDSYDGRSGQDILYLPAFTSNQLSVTTPSSTSHQLFFSGSGITITATDIEYILFRDRAVKLTPGSTGLTYYSWTPDLGPKSYSITAPATVDEGANYSATLRTTGIGDQAVYWRILNSTTSLADFEQTEGSATLNSGVASVSIPITADFETEGSQSATLQFFLDNTYTTPVASKAFSINDTSQEPVTYTVSAPLSVNEGGNFIATLNTTGLLDRTIYWKVIGPTANADDFELTQGSAPLRSGRATATVPIKEDFLTEGIENAEIRFFLDSSYISPVASYEFEINDTSLTTPVSYSISAPETVNESSFFGATLTTTGLANRTIYWKILHGTTESSDFAQNQGSTSLTSGRANVSTFVNADSLTEGSQAATLQFFLDSTYTTPVASKTFSINDTSTTPITYTISAPSTINEGGNFLASLTTTGISDRTIYWRINHGSTSSDDFDQSQGSASLVSGKADIAVPVIADLLTEGSQSATLQFFLDSTYTTPIASKTFSINDTSTTPVTYNISAPNAIDEGSDFLASLTTTGISDRTVYWRINHGSTSSDDFGQSQGSASLVSGKADIAVPVIADLLTEGSQSATLQFFLDSTYTTPVASKALSINDTSTTPITYSISAPNTVSEGSTSFAILNTTGIPDQTIYWKIRDQTTGAEDFALTQGSTALNAGEAEISFTALADRLTEGIETATLEFYLDSSYSTRVASKTFSINDNSKTPISYSISAPSTVDEGSELAATLVTTGIDDQRIYWDIRGAAGEFDLARSGSSELIDGEISVSIPVFADSLTEGLETATINFYLDNSFSAPVATRSFSIRDTSTSPPPPTPSPTADSSQVITGGAAKDTLIGGNGADKLTGGASQDRKTGNLGADTFIFTKTSDSPKVDANSSKRGSQSFRFIGKRGFSGTAGELKYSRGIISGDVNGDKKSDLEIQLLGAPTVSRAEIIL